MKNHRMFWEQVLPLLLIALALILFNWAEYTFLYPR
jgi:hypothetical protein